MLECTVPGSGPDSQLHNCTVNPSQRRRLHLAGSRTGHSRCWLWIHEETDESGGGIHLLSERIEDVFNMQIIYRPGAYNSEASITVHHVKLYPDNFITAYRVHAVLRQLIIHKLFTSWKHLCGLGIPLSTKDNTAAIDYTEIRWLASGASNFMFQNAKCQKIKNTNS